MAEPIAIITGGDTGGVDELLNFDISQSYDPDGTVKRWRINWGDGSWSKGSANRNQNLPDAVGHRYAAEGEYTVTLVVADNRNISSSPARLTVTIGEPDDPPDPEPPDPDTTPDQFTIPDQTGVALNTAITSVSITISGLTAAAPISVVDGEYSINGGSFTSAAGTISNTNTVRVRQTSANQYLTTSSATLTIGGVTDSFDVTTEAQAPIDTTPDRFGFRGQTGATTGSVVTSEIITITGINTTVPISISGASGEYSIDGAAFTTSAGTISAGQNVRVRLTASGSADTAVSTTLTVGTGTGIFTVRTAPAPADDTTPDPFNWPTITGQPGSTLTTSASITISGINTGVDISVAGGGSPAYSINGGAFTSSPGTGTVSNGNTIRVRLTSSATEGATLTASVTIGGVVGRFSVTTAVITTGGLTYYLAKAGQGGSDSNDGLSLGAPVLTWSKAKTLLHPQDTLLVRVGTFSEAFNNDVPSGTSWDKKVRITNYNGETVLFTQTAGVLFLRSQSYIEFDGIDMTGGSSGDGGQQGVIVCSPPGGSPAGTPLPHHIRIKNATITNASATTTGNAGMVFGNCADWELQSLEITGIGGPIGVYSNGPRLLIEGCDIHHVASSGIQIRTGGINSIVRKNTIRDISTSFGGGPSAGIPDTRIRGISIGDTASDSLVYNNLIYDIELTNAGGTPSQNSAGIYIFHAARVKLWHNTIARMEAYAIRVEGPNAEIRNNIGYQCGFGGISNNSEGTYVQSNNLMNIDPLFVNAASDNFALQALSPARNAGILIPSVLEDITGLSRPQGAAVDIGAYEYDE